MIKIFISLICGLLLLSKAVDTTSPHSFVNMDSSSCTTPQIKTSSDLGSKLFVKDIYSEFTLVQTSNKFVCLHQVVTMTDVCSQGSPIFLLRIM